MMTLGMQQSTFCRLSENLGLMDGYLFSDNVSSIYQTKYSHQDKYEGVESVQPHR